METEATTNGASLHLPDEEKHGESSNGVSDSQETSEASMFAEEMDFAALLDQYDIKTPERGELLQGIVIGIDRDAIVLDVGAKRDAVVSHSDLNRVSDEIVDEINVGDELPVYVIRTPSGGDELEVSIRRGLEQQDWLRAEDALESQEILSLPIVDFNKGGILVDYRQIRGFVPNSHVPALRHISSPTERDEYKQEEIGSTIEAKVIEVNRSRRRLVLSIKAAEMELREERMKALEPGQVVTGRVASIADFGAFVDIGGITGLVHISRLDWRRVGHPTEVVEVGDEVEVLVEKVDLDRERIRLNRQATLPNPWEVLANKHQEDDIVEGRITNIVDFGAFVALDDIGIEGLVHISELPESGEFALENLQSDQMIMVRILKIEADRQRLRLTLAQQQEEQATPDVSVDWAIRPEESEEETELADDAALEDEDTASTEEVYA